MDANYAIISCSHCGGSYDASGLQRSEQREAQKQSKSTKKPTKPANVKIKRIGDRVVYSTRWHSIGASILRTLVVTIWLLVASHILLTSVLKRDGWLGIYPSEYSYLHWLVIAALIWIAAAQILNSTTVSLSKQLMRIGHGPIPWGYPKSVPTKSIEQLFVASRVTQKKGDKQISYVLRAVDHKSNIISIPGRFSTAQEALFLEYDLEKELGLINRSQHGEIV